MLSQIYQHLLWKIMYAPESKLSKKVKNGIEIWHKFQRQISMPLKFGTEIWYKSNSFKII